MLDQLFYMMLSGAVQTTPLDALQQELDKCYAIETHSDRLQCYEKLSQKETDVTDAEKGSIKFKELSRLTARVIWDFEADQKAFKYTPYRFNYILPLTYNDSPNNEQWNLTSPDSSIDNIEIKFQIGAKVKLWDNLFKQDLDIWCAYTQLSLWQAYNSENSSPFRDTNYEPEIFFSWRTNWPVPGLGLTNRFVDFGFTHQSNGRARPLSRSWNRIYTRFGLENGNFALVFKPWYRIPEDSTDDDNPDIHRYVGYADLIAFWKVENGILKNNLFAVSLRNNLRDLDENKGSIQIDWGFPIKGGLRGYLQYFNGYGECLLDYNSANNRLGIGIMIIDWL